MFCTPAHPRGHPRVSEGLNLTPNTPFFGLITSGTVAWGLVCGKNGVVSECFLPEISFPALLVRGARPLRLPSCRAVGGGGGWCWWWHNGATPSKDTLSRSQITRDLRVHTVHKYNCNKVLLVVTASSQFASSRAYTIQYSGSGNEGRHGRRCSRVHSFSASAHRGGEAVLSSASVLPTRSSPLESLRSWSVV